MTRVALLGDPTRGLGNLAEPECRRIIAALDLAERMRRTGRMVRAVVRRARSRWTAAPRTWTGSLRCCAALIEFTQRGGEVNIVVTGVNVGAQPYWNAEATMLMHTRGILVMTPASAMVLTGKQALDFSGGVSAEDNFGIGGFDRVMGPNGQGQYWAPTLEDACEILLRHYEHTYVVPGERFPRRAPRPIRSTATSATSPHAADAGSDLQTVGDIFSAAHNPDRKKPFDIRSVHAGRRPTPTPSRWSDGRTGAARRPRSSGTRTSAASRCACWAWSPGRWPGADSCPPTARRHGPRERCSRSRRARSARAINAASGNRPLVVLANLSGFDGSPESMRRWQLEYGAEIGRAVTNFRRPDRVRGRSPAITAARSSSSPSGSTTGMEIAAVEGSLRLGDRRRAGRGHRVRPRGRARAPSSDPRVARAAGRDPRWRGRRRGRGAARRARRGDGRGSRGEARRGRRRVRPDPHHPAGAGGRLG